MFKQGKYGKIKNLGVVTQWHEGKDIRLAGKMDLNKKQEKVSLSAQDILDSILGDE